MSSNDKRVALSKHHILCTMIYLFYVAKNLNFLRMINVTPLWRWNVYFFRLKREAQPLIPSY